MPPAAAVTVERTREAEHGEFASNVALRLAKSARRNPRELAAAILAALPPNPLVARAEVAGAGFINFHLAPEAYARELAAIHARGAAYGESTLGAGERVLVEFVSANPTGPLHVGHGRQAAYGATLANILTRGRLQRRARVLHQRCRPADGHPRGQHLGALPRGLRRVAAVSRERLSRRICAAAGAAAARGSRRAAAAARGRGARGPAGGCSRGRQGSLHRCADRALPRTHRRRRLP